MSNVQAFADQYGPLAAQIGKQIGVAPDVILGQLGIETGWGKHVIPGTNNLGNIKDFSGGGTSAKDNQTGSTDNYRTYKTPDAFGSDYVSLLSRKYPGALNTGKDADAFATALKKGGYAEDPNYVTKVSTAVDMLRKLGEGVANAISGTAQASELPANLMPGIPTPGPVDDNDAFSKRLAQARSAPPPPSTPSVITPGVELMPGIPRPGPISDNDAFSQRLAQASSAPSAPSAQAPAQTHQGIIDNAVAGLNQGLNDTANGITQLIGHASDYALQHTIPNTAIAKEWHTNVGDFDKQIANQESQYQAATPGSIAAGVGRVAGDIIPTVLTGGGNLLTKAAALTDRLGTAAGAGNRLLGALNVGGKIAGGAALGGASSLVMPVLDAQNGGYWSDKARQVGTGAVMGGIIPPVGDSLRAVGARAATPITSVAPEVATLAQTAKDLGIPIRADQLINSKPINALSAALDYVPFSGKGSSLARQQQAFNTAISNTVGENTPNINKALDQAKKRLGAEFDKTLKTTPVQADNAFQNDLVRIMTDAQNEMTDAQYSVLGKQVNNILSKVQPGDVIDGDAAYNIKKGLDRLSKSSDSTQAFYARETRNALLDALNRSVSDGGAAFSKLRQQWANLRELERIVPHGAEGNISAARLGNMRGIKTSDLGTLADIGAQFLKGRVGDSGTAQRAGIYSLLGTGSYFNPLSAGIGITAGRAANSILGSNMLTNAMINSSLRRATFNGGNAVLASQPAQNALLERLAPYLIPAAAQGAVRFPSP